MLQRARPNPRDTSIAAYRAKRDFGQTAEPPPTSRKSGKTLRFVVQKHHARRLHWDFRLEHGGVLWSWAVPKGPSMDSAHKRLAMHVEDHPLDYGDFHGTIPAGNYGAGTVDIWDSGSWEPLGDPARDLQRGELKFRLKGHRLQGGFVLVRLKPRGKERGESWLLIKEHDEAERAGMDAAALETAPPPPRFPVPDAAKPKSVKAAEQAEKRTAYAAAPKSTPGPKTGISSKRAASPMRPPPNAPAVGAKRAPLPKTQKPELAKLASAPPEGDDWISEVKFDGYRLLIAKQGDDVRIFTRNGHDWSDRLPSIVQAVAALNVDTALLDGELVVLRKDGVSSFADLQAFLSGERRQMPLYVYAFDLLYLNGWDLRHCRLVDRKAALREICDWRGRLRYSDHLEGEADNVRRQACAMGLEGIICKRADGPYRGVRSGNWLKVKCQGRDEFVVLGWTPPAGSRQVLGALHLGFFDSKGRLHYVGGVGSGFDRRTLRDLGQRLAGLATPPPKNLQIAGDAPNAAINWVRPEIVVEVQYGGWSGVGRLRHAVFLGVREDKPARDVVRGIPDPDAERQIWRPSDDRAAPITTPAATRIVHAPKQVRDSRMVGDVTLTHADRELWPGLTKADLAEYWRVVADHALPGIAGRPMSLVRCPDGIAGEHFFQKHAHKGMPPQIHAGTCDEGPYVAITDAAGLVACAQIAAIELHVWGATEADPAHPDRIVFDLDPGEGVPFTSIVKAAHAVRKRLAALGLESFCRTSGGKGLHVVAPVQPRCDWATTRAFCRDLALQMEADAPDQFVATLPKARRRGRILVDWLRNGAGATAVASFSPRARPGAGVATPLHWREVTAKLDPTGFTLRTLPARLARQKSDPWAGFCALKQVLPVAQKDEGKR